MGFFNKIDSAIKKRVQEYKENNTPEKRTERMNVQLKLEQSRLKEAQIRNQIRQTKEKRIELMEKSMQPIFPKKKRPEFKPFSPF